MSSPEVDHRQFSTEDARRVLPRREPGAHKWGVGGLLIVAGSPGYVGAAALTAMAAGRAGAGMVNLVVQRSLISPIAAQVPEAGFTILPEGDLGSHTGRIMESIGRKAEKCAAFVIGPGLGDDDYARDLVASLLGIAPEIHGHSLGFGFARAVASNDSARLSLVGYNRPILVDADGLNALAKIHSWWEHIPAGRLLLTPHVGELSRLLDVPVPEIVANPARAAVAASQRFSQTVLLKGSPSIVTDGRQLYAAADSPPSLATGGSGDVLAGTIGAFLAQGMTMLDAASLAMYVGSRAARRVEQEVGTLGLVASDLPRAIAAQLATLE